MKYSLFKTIVVSAGLTVCTANAGIISTVSSSSGNGVNTCSTSSNVTLDYIAKSSDPNTQLNSHSYNSTSCGIYSGNDAHPTGTDNNLGLLGEGTLNELTDSSGYSYLDFIENSDLLALDSNIQDDPGWIYLGKKDGNNSFSYGEINGTSLDNVNGQSLFDVSLPVFPDDSPLGVDNLTKTDRARWSLTVNESAIAGATSLLGRLTTFDHLAFVVKAGNDNNGGGFSVYDFNFNDIFQKENENSDVFNFLTPYTFGGDLLLNLNNKQISHISIWARDPIIEVPEPSTILIFSVSLFGLAIRKLKK